MSQGDVKRTYAVALFSPLLMIVALVLAFENSAEGSWPEYFCWALAGIALANCFLMPALLYGYHNRHHIDIGDERPHDLSRVHRAAIAGAVGVPPLREVYRWLAND